MSSSRPVRVAVVNDYEIVIAGIAKVLEPYADRVAVVEDGRIAELGSHDELVAAGGSYAALWDSWQGSSRS